MFRLIAVVLPLALDTFAVSAALGLAGIGSGRRVRLGLLFAGFEAGMPLVGLAIGSLLGSALGEVGDYLAIAVLAGLGLYMLFGEGDREEARIARFATARGAALIALGLSVSLDELAIGFVLGVARVPVVPALVLIAVQAFAVSQLGFALGSRVGESVREGAERLAALALLALAALFLVAKLGAGFPGL